MLKVSELTVCIFCMRGKSTKKMKFLILIISFFIYGCVSFCPVVIPETSELPGATVNKKYHKIIEVQGGAINESSISVSIIPANSGLVWNPEETKYNFGDEEIINKDYHRIIISGIPKKTGSYSVIVSGFTLGTMYPGKDFYKKYSIKINH